MVVGEEPAQCSPHILASTCSSAARLTPGRAQEKDNAALEALGGVQGLCEALQSSPTGGLDPSPQESSPRASVEQRKQVCLIPSNSPYLPLVSSQAGILAT